MSELYMCVNTHMQCYLFNFFTRAGKQKITVFRFSLNSEANFERNMYELIITLNDHVLKPPSIECLGSCPTNDITI